MALALNASGANAAHRRPGWCCNKQRPDAPPAATLQQYLAMLLEVVRHLLASTLRPAVGRAPLQQTHGPLWLATVNGACDSV